MFLAASNIFTKFRRGHPCGEAKYRWGIKISQFSTNKSLYLANDTRFRHGCYGRRIGTHTRSIKWCHFQWERTITLFSRSRHSLTLNISQTATDTAIVTIETPPKLLNGISFNDLEWPLSQISRSRYYSTSNNSTNGKSYIHVWSIEWCRFQRSSVTHNLDFKVTVLVVYAMHG